jgi:apolipoprotein N-acyltransferase
MIPAVFLFCVGLAVFWGLAGLMYVKLVRGSMSPWRAVIFASVFFLIEYIRGHVFGGLPWNLPGYIFKAGGPVSQIASIIGIYGLSTFVLFLAAAIALAVQKNGRKFTPLLTGLVLLAGVYGFGAYRLNNAEVEYVDNVKLRIVHADIPQRDKFDPGKYVENVSHYLRLTASEGFDEVTHVIWPEGAVPGLMFEDQELMRVLNDLFVSNAANPPVFVTQTLRAEPAPGRVKPKYYNSAAAVIFANGQAPQISTYYDKRKLVPFGEFIPGGEAIEKLGLKSISSALESMSPGKTGNVPIISGLPPVSIQICYEIIFPGFTPENMAPRDDEPQWILNLSNDAWYGNSTGPRQHINQVAYRAIEEGLPIVRATSGGISGTIDAHGRIISSRNLGEDGVIDARLPEDMQKNAYNAQVNSIIALIIFIILITCYWGMQPGRGVQVALYNKKIEIE